MRRASAAAVLVAALLATSAAHAQSPGGPGLGDPYFPSAGNEGYEVDRYDLSLDVAPRSGRIAAVATIAATATQSLGSFSLDLRGLTVTAVSVDGAPAAFSRGGQELSINPSAPIASGASFTTVVTYRGKPGAQGSVGWHHSGDGTYVTGEPTGAPSWFPCNDHPSDKALYSFSVTVPRRYHAIANGLLNSVQRQRGSVTFAWQEPQPMATYLATVVTGRFRVRPATVNGLPSWTVLMDRHKRRARRTLSRLPIVLNFLSAYLGPYPFSSTGSIVTPGKFRGALETQTRPLYLGAPFGAVMAHEMAHQWFGDAVTIERWSDIWLNEGFATFAEWLWQTQGDDRELRDGFRRLYDLSAKARKRFKLKRLWGPVVSPPLRDLFGSAVYFRGGLTLEALRELVGNPVFFTILREWVARHQYGNATTEEFIALAEEISGRSLSRFFDVWLRQPGRPASWT